MDRTPYLETFNADHVPIWKCPICASGHLTLPKGSLIDAETADSENAHSHEAWDPDWIKTVFACVFQCSNGACKERVACTGLGTTDFLQYYEDDGSVGCQELRRLSPRYFHPPLVLMDIPATCPPSVAEHLRKSFSLFFADPGAALNCARTSLEELMTDLGIKRYVKSKGKLRPLPLHQRIELLPAKYEEQKELLVAVKWLGNAGSHSGSATTTSDVRTTYDLLEHVLSGIYDEKAKKLKAVAKRVNRRKGPIKGN
jgi:hypothetical protein